jgi:hypothetical protein
MIEILIILTNLVKVKYLVNELWERCKTWENWEKISLDKMMLKYKGKYCLTRVLFFNKPIRG